MAEMAPEHGAQIHFVSFPDLPSLVPTLGTPLVTRRAASIKPDVVVIDSIAAAYAAPWLLLGGPKAPVAAILHQPPGGSTRSGSNGTILGRLDLMTYERCATLMVASESLA